MSLKKRFAEFVAALAGVALLLIAPNFATAQTEQVLHSFGAGKDGNQVNDGIAMDASGNLYGTATGGGYYCCYQDGVVFKLSPLADGTWSETLAYSFGIPDGGYLPNVGVTVDRLGNLYGTTTGGGAYSAGTVYQLTMNAHGKWVQKTLHSFNPGVGDQNSNSVFVLVDPAGNVYGATTGGAFDEGFVFELSPTGTGEWKETILKNFSLGGSDGYLPHGLILDASGNLYATTIGSVYDGGAVIKFSPSAGGEWTESVLYSFNPKSAEGSVPSYLVFDSAGNLYGLTVAGGAYGQGIAYELIPSADVQWSEKVLYNFELSNGTVQTGLIIDASGNLYGTMERGGLYGAGDAYKLSPAIVGDWAFTQIHSFRSDGQDGATPYRMIASASGELYGTTANGGKLGDGTVFEITP